MSETLNIRALNMLIARIVEEHDRVAVNLISGSAEKFEDYRECIGFIKGLTYARSLCEGVEQDLISGKREK